jgi:hypothetical protein
VHKRRRADLQCLVRRWTQRACWPDQIVAHCQHWPRRHIRVTARGVAWIAAQFCVIGPDCCTCPGSSQLTQFRAEHGSSCANPRTMATQRHSSIRVRVSSASISSNTPSRTRLQTVIDMSQPLRIVKRPSQLRAAYMWTQGPRHRAHMILLPGRLQTTEQYSSSSNGSAAFQCATAGDPVAQFMSATTRPVLRCKLPTHTWPRTCVDQTETIQAVFACHHSRVDRRGALCARAAKEVIATRVAHGGHQNDEIPAIGPRSRRARAMSLGMIVTRLACIAQ